MNGAQHPGIVFFRRSPSRCDVKIGRSTYTCIYYLLVRSVLCWARCSSRGTSERHVTSKCWAELIYDAFARDTHACCRQICCATWRINVPPDLDNTMEIIHQYLTSNTTLNLLACRAAKRLPYLIADTAAEFGFHTHISKHAEHKCYFEDEYARKRLSDMQAVGSAKQST